MATKTISWSTGTGSVTVTYVGSGDGTIQITSDPNNLYEVRSMQITVKTTDNSVRRTVTVNQAAKVKIDISTAIVTAANQTYSGSAKTPTPTVILNGQTIPGSGYDVIYSNNTNAGTATITVTGKNEYTGTATGTFIIAKADPSYVAPAATTNLTYNGSARYLTTTGSTSDGTIEYSSDGSTWYSTRRQGTNAGSYTTYWRLVGDSNHNDVARSSITTTIAKASRTLSFDSTYYVLDKSSSLTKTATPSAGSGDGAITYSISSTTYATINSSSGKVTAKTSDGSATVTATIAEGTNYLSASASYTLYVFATIHNYAYTGSVQNTTLPPGSYKFQCWGAQGGSNAAASSYSITAQAGGKGGYSEGVLIVTSAKTVYIFVGGQGSSSGNGGWNCGGGSAGSDSGTIGNTSVVSRYGCGGGATDIALVTSNMSYSSYRNNRSSASLLSRIIVAGGGSGGAMCRKDVTSSTNTTIQSSSFNPVYATIQSSNNTWVSQSYQNSCTLDVQSYKGCPFSSGNIPSGTTSFYTFLKETPVLNSVVKYATGYSGVVSIPAGGSFSGTVPSDAKVLVMGYIGSSGARYPSSITFTVTTTTTSYISQVGYYGGGTNGGAGRTNEQAKQNSAGTGGEFGKGSSKLNSSPGTYPYKSGAGGAGWYGGGSQESGYYDTVVGYSGGGSGFVNTAASAGNRPSGYTGLQLDSGETKAGNTSFPNTAGTGNETGHSGNGYAKITRLS